MMFPVMIEPCDSQFAATLLGTPTIRAVGAMRDDALRALHTDLAQGEFVTLKVSAQGAPTSQAPTSRPPPSATSAPQCLDRCPRHITMPQSLCVKVHVCGLIVSRQY
jgi:hypothetical protein